MTAAIRWLFLTIFSMSDTDSQLRECDIFSNFLSLESEIPPDKAKP